MLYNIVTTDTKVRSTNLPLSISTTKTQLLDAMLYTLVTTDRQVLSTSEVFAPAKCDWTWKGSWWMSDFYYYILCVPQFKRKRFMCKRLPPLHVMDERWCEGLEKRCCQLQEKLRRWSVCLISTQASMGHLVNSWGGNLATSTQPWGHPHSCVEHID